MDPSSTDFLVYFGLDANGRLVPRLEARKDQVYVCPNCRTALLVKDGPIRAKHFCHFPSIECSEESILHKTAKLRIVQAVQDWRSGKGPRPMFVRRCAGICGQTLREAVPDEVDDAKAECRLESCRRIFDVGLLAKEKAIFGVEILVSHQVDEEKAADLRLPWVEVAAEDVLQNPAEWFAIQNGNIPCEACNRLHEELLKRQELEEKRRLEEEARRKFEDEEYRRRRETAEAERQKILEEQARAERLAAEERERELESIAARYGIDLFKYRNRYRIAAEICRRCGEKAIVFDWYGRPENGSSPPPDPVPASLAPRRCALAMKSYWINTCHCGASLKHRYTITTLLEAVTR